MHAQVSPARTARIARQNRRAKFVRWAVGLVDATPSPYRCCGEHDRPTPELEAELEALGLAMRQG